MPLTPDEYRDYRAEILAETKRRRNERAKRVLRARGQKGTRMRMDTERVSLDLCIHEHQDRWYQRRFASGRLHCWCPLCECWRA